MARIAVTGAAGNVGRQTLEALDDHDVTPVTHREHDDVDGPVLDVADRAALVDALDDHDVLVHLAANPSPDAAWSDLREPNVDGVYNAYEAALGNDADRVVFASTNHVCTMYTVSDPDRPESMAASYDAVDADDPPRPDSYYGVTKVFGEAMGNYYADRHGLDVVNLRIGWLMTEAELREQQDAPADEARFARAMWLSPRDCRDVLRRAALSDLPRSPLTVNAVSRNLERSLSLTHTMRTLGYRPRDDSAEVLGE